MTTDNITEDEFTTTSFYNSDTGKVTFGIKSSCYLDIRSEADELIKQILQALKLKELVDKKIEYYDNLEFDDWVVEENLIEDILKDLIKESKK